MPTKVVLDVFSGRPNPTWVLPAAESEALERRIAALGEKTRLKPPGIDGRLGYRGISLHRPAGDPAGPLDLRIHGGVIGTSRLAPNLVDPGRAIEHAIIERAGAHLGARLKAYLQRELAKPVEAGSSNSAGTAQCPACVAPDTPPYQPNLWNVPNVQPYNNCYNYANNQITNTFAQPGRAHGKIITSMDCNTVMLCAIADGLTQTQGFNAPLGSGAGWYVALVIWPLEDYHWYRQDADGCWSHKTGGAAATNLDNSGNQISDPQTCDRGEYTTFCTYMITSSHVVIN
ncbi:MAG TPA: hypothetical protein VGU66_19025 [Candidatus Elarobacter sp.]|nr:hypothetical protein [Candidatus Elarobacter sp.]